MILEICSADISSVEAAAIGGADRIEVCDNLKEGGTSPSLGMIRAARKYQELMLFVLIRPRGGNFVFTKAEKEIMLEDIRICREEEVDGIVCGALLQSGAIDIPFMNDVRQAAANMELTFHRAFDLANNPLSALEQIIDIGCNRILTSGQASSAVEGKELIKQLIRKAGNSIIIMPGAGLGPHNIKAFAIESQAQEFHMSLRNKTSVPDDKPNNKLDAFKDIPEQSMPGKIKEVRRILDSLHTSY